MKTGSNTAVTCKGRGTRRNNKVFSASDSWHTSLCASRTRTPVDSGEDVSYFSHVGNLHMILSLQHTLHTLCVMGIQQKEWHKDKAVTKIEIQFFGWENREVEESDRVNSQRNGTKKTRDVEIELFADIVISCNFLYQAIPIEGLVIFIYLFVQITVWVWDY